MEDVTPDPEPEPVDLCEDITCLNGGSCEDGECICPDRYQGENCEEEKIPTKVRSNAVTALFYPLTDPNGASWDLFDEPDLYLVIKYQGEEVFRTATQFNASSTDVVFQFIYEYSNPEEFYSFSIYDEDDLTSDDLIVGMFFTPYQAGEGFPLNIEKDCSQGDCIANFRISGLVYTH